MNVDLDPREIRALHFCASFSAELRNSRERDPPPDGRKVYPLDSALMKLEVALTAAGEEL